MKAKLHKDVVRVGTVNVDHTNLKPVEAVTMSIVAILAIAVGTIYGSILF